MASHDDDVASIICQAQRVGAGEVVDYFPVASPFPQPIELHAIMDTTWEPMAGPAGYYLPRHQTHFEQFDLNGIL
jgi:hypothetical protein